MGPSRKAEIGLGALLYLVKNMKITRTELPEFMNVELKKVLESPLLGYFCVYVKGENDEILEVGVLQKFPTTVNLLMNRKYALGIRIKFAKEMKKMEGEEMEELGSEFDFLMEAAK